MIISPAEIMAMPEFAGVPEATVRRKLDALEDLIRAYTNNNFQNRKKRFAAPSTRVLCGSCPFFAVGDTVQITESINDGVYVIKSVDDEETTLDKELIDAAHNLITKVEYPSAIVDGVVNLMLWDVQNRAKVGIQSETLSRHSVTYFAQDANDQLMGYPATLFGFLKPYTKARF